MIQRIQTIWLFIAAALSAVMLFYPVSHFYDGIDFPQPLNMDNYTNFLYVGMFVLNLLALIFSVVAIFLFKNRKQQLKMIRLSQIFVLLFILSAGLGFVWFKNVDIVSNFNLDTFKNYMTEYRGMILPLMIMIYNRLGFSGVKGDEKLIRSMDRLR